MKEIRLPKNARVRVGADLVTLDDAIDDHRQVQRNVVEVIASALVIEKQLEFAISFFLLGGDFSKRNFFDANILGSDWCGLAAKRKVVKSLLASSGTMGAGEIEEFDRSIMKVMKYRNALTHGELDWSTKGMVLKYFEGEPREKALTDAYWEQLVADFGDAHERTKAMLYRLGAVKDLPATNDA